MCEYDGGVGSCGCSQAMRLEKVPVKAVLAVLGRWSSLERTLERNSTWMVKQPEWLHFGCMAMAHSMR
jgi:hypothetical protein